MAFRDAPMPRPPTPSTDALLAECSWLRALARRLVEDPEGAEDAVQDTLVAALGRPADATVERGWLATVLRNAVRQRFRAGARRRERERWASGGAATTAPAAGEVVERIALQRRVCDAVEALDEPYRTAIVLRFLDGRSPAEVARRTGAPVKTVHTRVERGLARLRRSLDRAHGGERGRWLAALVPFAGPAPVSSTPVLGVALMNAKWSAVVAVAALSLVGVMVWRGDGPEPAAIDASIEAREDLAAVPSAPGEGSGDAREARGLLEPAPSRSVATGTAETGEDGSPAAAFRGRVRDVDGRPVRGVGVGLEIGAGGGVALAGAPYEARSDDAGIFEMPVPPRSGRLVAVDGRWASVARPPLAGGAPPPEEPVVVVAPRGSYAGVVVDSDGAGLPGAELAASLGQATAEALGLGSFEATPLVRAESGEGGTFALEGLPLAPGTTLRVSLAGHLPTTVALPPTPTDDLRVVLEPVSGPEWIVGRVVTAEGEPAGEAWVGSGAAAVETGPAGRFHLAAPEGAKEVRLVAVAPGRLPAEAVVVLPAAEEVVLRLGDPPLSIAGVVLDAAGAPVPGALVWTTTGTVLGSLPVAREEGLFSLRTTVENLVAGEPSAAGEGRRAVADDLGRFVLEGLLYRDYDLAAAHPRTLELVERAGVPAGTPGVTLTLGGEERLQRVAGRVVSPQGTPLADVVVGLMRRAPTREGWRVLPEEHAQRTGADGRFAFPAVCVEGTSLTLRGDAPSELMVDLRQYADLEALELTFAVPATCTLRVDLRGWAGQVTALQVEDADDRPLMLMVASGVGSIGSTRLGVSGGRLETLTVPERARSVVLLRGSEEVLRFPVVPRPGEVVEVRPR